LQAAQTYVERPPIPALAGVVSSVWVQQVAPDALPYVQRNIPSGVVEVVWRTGSEPRIVGPLTEASVELLAPGTTIAGLRFVPGAAAAVLGVPTSELVDLAVDGDAVWGHSSLEAETPEEALAALQRHLVARLAAPDPVVMAAVSSLRWATDDVASLTSSLHISERQLRRRFRASIGFAPKPLHRMLRFQRFLSLTQHAIASGASPADGIARLAAEAGYADQPHLNRECLRLTGTSPGGLLGEAADHCGCGHDHAASYLPVLRARRPGLL